jgi:hypothetical protein
VIVERIDAAQARDHLELVERILAESQPRLCTGGEYFVVWGIGSAYVTLLFALLDRRRDARRLHGIRSERITLAITG